MPQLDQATFTSQLAVCICILIAFFFFFVIIVLPILYKTLRVRELTIEELDSEANNHFMLIDGIVDSYYNVLDNALDSSLYMIECRELLIEFIDSIDDNDLFVEHPGDELADLLEDFGIATNLQVVEVNRIISMELDINNRVVKVSDTGLLSCDELPSDSTGIEAAIVEDGDNELEFEMAVESTEIEEEEED